LRVLLSHPEPHYVGIGLSLAHQFCRAVRHHVGRGEQHRVGTMHISARNRSPLMPEERQSSARNSEISSDRGQRVPQDVRGYLRRKSGQPGYPRPEFLEMQDRLGAAARGREHPTISAVREGFEHIAGRMRQRPDTTAGFGIGESRSAPSNQAVANRSNPWRLPCQGWGRGFESLRPLQISQQLNDDAQRRRLLSIVVYGRNDNHGYNLHKRAAVSINCLTEMLPDPADELIFVDYNSPDDLSTSPEAIRDTLTSRAKAMLRILRVRPEVHRRFQQRTHLSGLGPVARNVGLRASNPANRWILSTHSDIILVTRKAPRLSELVGDARESGHPGRPPLRR
jgi:hypothetical protein